MIKTVYIVHHSHTDIGYTDFAENVVEKQVRDLARVVELCRQDSDFRWVCESAWVVDEFLKRKSSQDSDDLLRLLQSGQIEMSANYTQYLTECLRPEELFHSFDFARNLKTRYGIESTSMFVSDIGGYSWALPSFCAEAGVRQLIAGVGGYKTLFPLTSLPNLFRFCARDRRSIDFWHVGLSDAFPQATLFAQYAMALYACMLPLWSSAAGRPEWACNDDENPEWAPIYNEVLSVENGSYWQSFVDWFERQSPDEGLDRNSPDFLLRKLVGRIEKSGYSGDAILLQYAADNYGPDVNLAPAIRSWNDRGLKPALRLATAEEFFRDLRNSGSYSPPDVSGELACAWTDHAIHMPVASARARVEGERLGALERLLAAEILSGENIKDMADESGEFLGKFADNGKCLGLTPQEVSQPGTDREIAQEKLRRNLDEGYRLLALHWEHTYGLSCFPESADILAAQAAGTPLSTEDQRFCKLKKSWRDKEELTERLGRLNDFIQSRILPVAEKINDHRDWINSLPWVWTHSFVEVEEPDFSDSISPAQNGVAFSGRLNAQKTSGRWRTEYCSATGVRVVLPAEADKKTARLASEGNTASRLNCLDPEGKHVLNSEYYTITLDRGEIVSLILKDSGEELVDPDAGGGFFQYMVTRIDGLAPTVRDGGVKESIRRTVTVPTVSDVLFRSGELAEILQLRSHMVTGGGKLQLVQTLVFPRDRPGIELVCDLLKPASTVKEEHFLCFPFCLNEARMRCSLADSWFEIGSDELSGSHTDYYSPQTWIDLNGNGRGISWGCREAFGVCVGEIRTHEWAGTAYRPDRPQLFSYLMSNNSLTNLPLWQEGRMRFSYSVLPYRGEFSHERALRFGQELVNPPVAITEKSLEGLYVRDPLAELFSVDRPEVVLRHVLPLGDGHFAMRLLETSGKACLCQIRCRGFVPHGVEVCTVCGVSAGPLLIEKETFSVSFQPNERLSLIVW